MLEPDPFAHTKAPWMSHLGELKRRVFWCVGFYLLAFGASLYFSQEIYRFLLQPLALTALDTPLVYTGLTEAFSTYIHLALSVAWAISLPFIAVQLYCFLAPGLYLHEKRGILPYLVLSPVLFFLGGGLCYYHLFPLAWKFFLSFETRLPMGSQGGISGDVPILLLPKMNEYLSLVMQCVTAFGLAFQLPVLLMLLGHLRIVTPEMLKKQRKYAVVGIFAVAAVITPPDAISQISLAVPMILLYEIAIIGIRLIQRP